VQTAWLTQREKAPRTVPCIGLPDVPPGGTAAEFICRTVLDAPGEVTVVAIGPLTNIAAAIEAEPDVATAMASLVIMGGTVAVPGNVTPAAEFNIWMDPEAAGIVFGSGAPITMVGLDVCHQTSFDRDRAARFRRSGSPLAGFVADAAESWIDVREQLFPEHEALHLYDTLAVAAAIEPDLLQTRVALVEVETSDGPAQGMTVTYLNDALRQLLTGRDPNAAVAVGVESARFAARFDERVAACL
jgi:purine nucleosidase